MWRHQYVDGRECRFVGVFSIYVAADFQLAIISDASLQLFAGLKLFQLAFKTSLL
jgi:hypothetical protein